MADRKILNNEELEKVSGGADFDENTIKTYDDIHGGIIYNSMSNPDSTFFAVGSGLDEYAQRDDCVEWTLKDKLKKLAATLLLASY